MDPVEVYFQMATDMIPVQVKSQQRCTNGFFPALKAVRNAAGLPSQKFYRDNGIAVEPLGSITIDDALIRAISTRYVGISEDPTRGCDVHAV